MENKKEKTAPDVSVGADTEQPTSKNTTSSISENGGNIKSFEELQREMKLRSDPSYLHTISMNELFDTQYRSKQPLIDGLLYPGTYIFAGSPKLGKSFLMAQLAYHVSTGKEMFTEIINSHVKEESEKLSVFQQGGVYLATKKSGKNNPKEAEIQADNAARQEWNRTVDVALVEGVPEEDILTVKREKITDKTLQSIRTHGWLPDMLQQIIRGAKDFLQEMIFKFKLSPKPVPNDIYQSKYQDSQDGLPIDTYTESRSQHYKIWCIENGAFSIKMWYMLMLVSLDKSYQVLFEEIMN